MTVWSLLTANEDPTSPSSPTLPAEQPKRLKHSSGLTIFPLHLTALSEGRGLSHILPALSAEAVIGYNSRSLHVVFYRKEEVQEKTKINVLVLCGLLKTDHGDNTTLRFLVIMLYTEQASIHHNEWEKKQLHKLGYCYESIYSEKGHLYRTYTRKTNHFK